MPRLVPLAGQLRMPWRNGTGETREVAAAPSPTTLDTFLWRVSIASVVRDGPFSRFAGVARTLLVVEGAGVRLTGPGICVELARRSTPAILSGGDDVHCHLLEGAVEILNVMVRGARPAEVTLADGRSAHVPPAPIRVCVSLAGAIDCSVDRTHTLLAGGDALVLDAPADAPAMLSVVPRARNATAAIAIIHPAGAV
jgi:uncharacterized protein